MNWNYELKAYLISLTVADSGLPMTLFHSRIDGALTAWW